MHEAGPAVAALKNGAFYLIALSSVPVFCFEWSSLDWFDYVNGQLPDRGLRDGRFDIGQVFIEVEEELDAIEILVELFDWECVMTFIVKS